MFSKQVSSFLAGFIILFFIYHFPEFFSSFWLMAICKIGFLLLAFILAKAQGWKGLGGYGLSIMPGWACNLTKGIAIGILGFGLSIVFSVFLKFETIISLSTFNKVLAQIPMLLLMTAIPSLAEDILTRGYLYGHLRNKMKKENWVLLSAVLFVLNHIWRLNSGMAILTYLFFLGLLLALAVWQTKSLWLAFGIHWGSNLAYESSNSFLNIESLAQHHEDTWILASIWASFFLFLFLYCKRNKMKISNGKTANHF